MNRIMMLAALVALVASAPACDKKDGAKAPAKATPAAGAKAAPAAGDKAATPAAGDKAATPAAGDKAAAPAAGDKAAAPAAGDKAAAPAAGDKAEPAVGTPPAAAGKIATAEELETIGKGFEGIVKAMCECKDEACIKSQQGAMMAFMQKTQALGRPDPKAPGTAKFMERMATASKSMQACIKKVMPNAGAPPAGAGAPPGGAKTPPTAAQLKTAMTEFEAIVETICACKDEACTKTKRAGLTAFMMKTRSWGRPDMNDPSTKDFMGKMQVAGKKMADCMAKTAPKPATDGKEPAPAKAPAVAPKKTEAPAPKTK